MEIPIELQEGLERELSSAPGSKLAALASELSEGYRAGKPSGGVKYIRSSEDAAAYAAFRLPATYAAVYSAVKQARDRSQGLKPKSLLDVGAGPGTAMWAAENLFPEIKTITLLEREEHMISLGKRLASHSSVPSIKNAKWVKADITDAWNITPQDLVIASYVLNEIAQDKSEAFIKKLWESTADTLIIIEPGTPAGSNRIKLARELLIKAGGKTTAPCPHDNPCPMMENDWCHFSMRVARSRIHRRIKGGELSYEDEKFAFLCMSRNSSEGIDGVVIRHPQIRKGHIKLELCTPGGLDSRVVTRKDKELFKLARDIGWGSIMKASGICRDDN